MGTSAGLHVRRSVLATATAFVVVLAACGAAEQNAGSEVAPTAPPTASSITDTEVAVERRPAEDTATDVAASYEWLDQDIIFYASPMVVVGTVREVNGPFWNSADGQKWSDSPAADDIPGRVAPGLYREIVLDIETVVRDDYNQAAATIVVIAPGGGERSQDPTVVGGGRFTQGEQVVLFLSTQVLYTRDDMFAATMPFWGYQSVFHVGADGVVVPDGAAQSVEAEQNLVVAPGDPTPPPVVRDFMTLDEFVAMVEGARSVRNEQWELYRSDPSVVDAEIEFMREYFETGILPEPPASDTEQ